MTNREIAGYVFEVAAPMVAAAFIGIVLRKTMGGWDAITVAASLHVLATARRRNR